MQIRGSSFENIKLLSVVIPSFKQEKTIVKDIKKISKTLQTTEIPFEIIIVVDGFVDNTFEKVKKLENQNIHIFGYEKNMGKGYAIRYGFSKAKGDIVGFLDSGMDLEPSGIHMLLSHMEWYNADVIVGSKLHPVSQVKYPLTRRVLSWGYRTLTHTLFGFKVKDTQVGMKFFKRKVVDAVFPKLLEKGYAIDIEVLAVAYTLGFKRIFEAPVKLRFTSMSTITQSNFWKVILYMLSDTLKVYYRQKISHHYVKNKKSRTYQWTN